MTFSGALTLTDLNDYLGPSQACIKPVEQANGDVQSSGAATEIQIDSAGNYFEVAQSAGASGKVVPSGPKKLETAQISLNDCLACSGCITSAESVLITLQSHEEVLNVLTSNPPPSSPDHKIPVLSIAPQSLASFAASITSTSSKLVTLQQVLLRVKAFCKQELGISHVYDTTFARHVALQEHIREFQERKASGSSQLPMLASACPGWVCYAEKAHAEMLPFLSRTKSPQQVMGTLVKEWLGKKWRQTPDRIYHVTVMPCYDKKLEASRTQFYSDIYSTRDVDCVITTGELELMMREKKWDLNIAVEDEAQSLTTSGQVLDAPELLQHPGSSSGSYLNSIVARYLSPSREVTTKLVRSNDYEEILVREKLTGEVVFKGAKCYGFRNVQNVVRKVAKAAGIHAGQGAAGRMIARRRKGEDEAAKERYDYVEVMACPGGCVNGGGQLRPLEGSVGEGFGDNVGMPSSRWGDKEWTKKVEEAYWLAGNSSTLTAADTAALKMMEEICGGRSDEIRRTQLFRTTFRAVEGDVHAFQVKW